MTPDELGNLLDHLPHNAWELVGLLALLAFVGQAIGGGVILRWHKQRNTEASVERKAIQQTAEAIKGQVVNGHTEPLRADIDAMKADMADLRTDVADLRTDVRDIMHRQERWASVMPIIHTLSDEIRGLRADIAEEQESRRNLAADVRAGMAKHRDDMTALDRRLRDATG